MTRPLMGCGDIMSPQEPSATCAGCARHFHTRCAQAHKCGVAAASAAAAGRKRGRPCRAATPSSSEGGDGSGGESDPEWAQRLWTWETHGAGELVGFVLRKRRCFVCSQAVERSRAAEHLMRHAGELARLGRRNASTAAMAADVRTLAEAAGPFAAPGDDEGPAYKLQRLTRGSKVASAAAAAAAPPDTLRAEPSPEPPQRQLEARPAEAPEAPEAAAPAPEAAEGGGEEDKGDKEDKEEQGEGEGEGEVFEVEAIRDHRVKHKRLEYLVKWKGYAEHSNTWEPEKNCRGCPAIIKAYWKGRPNKSHHRKTTPAKGAAKTAAVAAAAAPPEPPAQQAEGGQDNVAAAAAAGAVAAPQAPQTYDMQDALHTWAAAAAAVAAAEPSGQRGSSSSSSRGQGAQAQAQWPSTPAAVQAMIPQAVAEAAAATAAASARAAQVVAEARERTEAARREMRDSQAAAARQWEAAQTVMEEESRAMREHLAAIHMRCDSIKTERADWDEGGPRGSGASTRELCVRVEAAHSSACRRGAVLRAQALHELSLGLCSRIRALPAHARPLLASVASPAAPPGPSGAVLARLLPPALRCALGGPSASAAASAAHDALLRAVEAMHGQGVLHDGSVAPCDLVAAAAGALRWAPEDMETVASAVRGALEALRPDADAARAEADAAAAMLRAVADCELLAARRAPGARLLPRSWLSEAAGLAFAPGAPRGTALALWRSLRGGGRAVCGVARLLLLGRAQAGAHEAALALMAAGAALRLSLPDALADLAGLLGDQRNAEALKCAAASVCVGDDECVALCCRVLLEMGPKGTAALPALAARGGAPAAEQILAALEATRRLWRPWVAALREACEASQRRFDGVSGMRLWRTPNGVSAEQARSLCDALAPALVGECLDAEGAGGQQRPSIAEASEAAALSLGGSECADACAVFAAVCCSLLCACTSERSDALRRCSRTLVCALRDKLDCGTRELREVVLQRLAASGAVGGVVAMAVASRPARELLDSLCSDVVALAEPDGDSGELVLSPGVVGDSAAAQLVRVAAQVAAAADSGAVPSSQAAADVLRSTAALVPQTARAYFAELQRLVSRDSAGSAQYHANLRAVLAVLAQASSSTTPADAVPLMDAWCLCVRDSGAQPLDEELAACEAVLSAASARGAGVPRLTLSYCIDALRQSAEQRAAELRECGRCADAVSAADACMGAVDAAYAEAARSPACSAAQQVLVREFFGESVDADQLVACAYYRALHALSDRGRPCAVLRRLAPSLLADLCAARVPETLVATKVLAVAQLLRAAARARQAPDAATLAELWRALDEHGDALAAAGSACARCVAECLCRYDAARSLPPLLQALAGERPLLGAARCLRGDGGALASVLRECLGALGAGRLGAEAVGAVAHSLALVASSALSPQGLARGLGPGDRERLLGLTGRCLHVLLARHGAELLEGVARQFACRFPRACRQLTAALSAAPQTAQGRRARGGGAAAAGQPQRKRSRVAYINDNLPRGSDTFDDLAEFIVDDDEELPSFQSLRGSLQPDLASLPW
eukprot:m51a1_g4743 hypothetical protein (1543) ;mRNA; f:377571-385415